MASPNFGGQNHENFGLVSDIEALFYAKPRNIYNSMYIVNWSSIFFSATVKIHRRFTMIYEKEANKVFQFFVLKDKN